MSSSLIIIGGGAAGLMAAIKAAQEGISSLIIEKMAKPARKLGISGKGRGNLTNTAQYSEFLLHFNNKGRFLKTAFKNFFNSDLIEFFNNEGVKTTVERGKRVFTASGKAPEAANKLINAAHNRGVKILCNTSVAEIICENNSCSGVKTTDNQFLPAKAIILATGGRSYPLTGSTGDGYALAARLGHKILTPLPSLVGLAPETTLPPKLEKLSLKNISAALIVNGRQKAIEIGEMTFLDGLLAGPVIITLSRLAVDELHKGNEVKIKLDLKPALSHEKLDRRLLRDIQADGQANCTALLRRLLPGNLVDFCLDCCKVDKNMQTAQLGSMQRRTIRNWLKEAEFAIGKPGPWEQAIVTRGGVDCRQINPTTMESRLIKNLFFAGEVIDIDADTGGFNLQAAFSTGWLAGLNAAQQIKRS